LLILPDLSLPPLEFCFGASPIQAEKSLPDRNAFGSATLATSAVGRRREADDFDVRHGGSPNT
jgi:hypothetical protein